MDRIKELVRTFKEAWEMLDARQRAKLLVSFPVVFFILCPIKSLGNIADYFMDKLGDWIVSRPKLEIVIEYDEE